MYNLLQQLNILQMFVINFFKRRINFLIDKILLPFRILFSALGTSIFRNFQILFQILLVIYLIRKHMSILNLYIFLSNLLLIIKYRIILFRMGVKSCIFLNLHLRNWLADLGEKWNPINNQMASNLLYLYLISKWLSKLNLHNFLQQLNILQIFVINFFNTRIHFLINKTLLLFRILLSVLWTSIFRNFQIMFQILMVIYLISKHMSILNQYNFLSNRPFLI